MNNPVFIYLVFVVFISLCNFLFQKYEKTKQSFWEAIGGILFLGILSFTVFYISYALYNGKISLLSGQGNLWSNIGIFLAFYIFARNEMLSIIFRDGRNIEQSVSTFFGALGVHFVSMLVSIGILFPYLTTIFDLPFAIVLSALSFSMYHFAQFYFFPKGITLTYQFQLFAFSLGYVGFYYLTKSFLLTFLLQHFIASTTFIYNKDYDFGKRDFPFYFGIILVIAFFIFYLKILN